MAIVNTGLVTSVGLSAPAACAAIRARLANSTETRFIGSGGEWIVGHIVPLGEAWRGLAKQVKMAAMAIAECLERIPREEWGRIPVLLCVAEPERPGRLEGLNDELFVEIQQQLEARFAAASALVPHGRVGVAIALRQARKLLYETAVPRVLIVSVDSLLNGATLSVYEREDRVLTNENSNGFLPGEGAGAILVARPSGQPELVCVGLGFGVERARIDSDEPLRADGLTRALSAALADAGCQIYDVDFRITDIAGEQYSFKEAALAIGRILRKPKDELDIWHPAEYIGETGAVAGAAALAVADAACRKGYAPGPRILTHMANDGGERAATVLHFRGV
jgi:3-oxoacyl-[acyl-carrier-protein] synthase-1